MSNYNKYEILKSLPAYGEMYISISKDDEDFFSEGFVVKFQNPNGTFWIANFKPGWTNFNEIIEFQNRENLLVIAGGTCYFINPDEKKATSVFGVGYCKSFKTEKDQIVLQDRIDLTIIEPSQEFWHSHQISNEEIKDLVLEKNIVSGKSLEYNEYEKWIDFTFNIETKKLKYNRDSIWKFW